MATAIQDAGSFRDPGGRVLTFDNRILRAVLPPHADAYTQARDSTLIDRLARRGWLLDSAEVNATGIAGLPAETVHLLEHPKLPFISYPYEWSFSLHRAAALLQLDVMIEALASGFQLSDATAYNVQFQGTQPVFIDHLSLVPYQDGQLWQAHRQFCMQFLNPLIMWTRLGLQPNAWFRGSLEGIAPEDLAPLLKLRHKASWTVFSHVVMQAWLHRKSLGSSASASANAQGRLSKTALTAMLTGLRDFIAHMALPQQDSVWGNYAHDNSYDSDDARQKRAFVSDMVRATQPGLLFDFGCNSGDYSEVALEAGAQRVVGFDYDHNALEAAYRRFSAQGRWMLPLWLDAANPSPAQGWAQQERKGLNDRAQGDALIALAFIHHIAIGRNVPLDMVIDWLIGMAPAGVIEFPTKADAMVRRLLANRTDIFPDYDEAHFCALVGQRARIVKTEHLLGGDRLLLWFDRR